MAASVYSVSLKKENAHEDPIYCCVWAHVSDDDSKAAPRDLILTAGSLAQIKVWEWRSADNTIELRNVLRDHLLAITSLAVSPDGHTLVSTAMDFTLVIWDLDAGEKVHRIRAPNIWRATFSPDGLRIVTGCHSGDLVVYDVEKGTVMSINDTRQQFVIAVAWSPKDNYVASGSTNGAVCVLDSVHFKVMHTFKDHKESIKNLAFSPNSKLLATSSIDCSFKLYDVIAGKLLHTLERSSWALAVCFSPDGKQLALGTGDGEVVIASTDGLQVLKTFKEHEGHVWQLQFNRKGGRLVSVGKDKSLNMYEIPPLVNVKADPVYVNVHLGSQLTSEPTIAVLKGSNPPVTT